MGFKVIIGCVGALLLFAIVSCRKEEQIVEPQASVTIAQPTYVMIGNQKWMDKNLSVSTYSDGTIIPQVTDPDEWSSLTTGAWCWYNNDSVGYSSNFGRLYNWYAVVGIHDEISAVIPTLRKHLAPDGWHVPSDEEWSLMINYLDPLANGGMNPLNSAGGVLKSTGNLDLNSGLWYPPNDGASDSFGFSGRPGGRRRSIESPGAGIGVFEGVGANGLYWTDTESGEVVAFYRALSNTDAAIVKNSHLKKSGFSVRCIKD